MSNVLVERRVKASPEVAWSVLADIAGYAEVAPNLRAIDSIRGSAAGLIRRCRDIHGKAWTEVCTEWVEGRRYTMEMQGGSHTFPVTTLTCTFALEEQGGATVVSLDCRYRPKFGLIGRVMDLVHIRSGMKALAEETVEGLVAGMRSRQWAYMDNVAQILRHKGRDVITITPADTLASTARLLREKRIGVVLVLSDEGRLIGLVSERDIVAGLAEHGADALQMTVDSVMTRRLVVCAPDNDIGFVMACMTDRRVRHLPVIEHDELVGIISIGDVVRQRIQSLESQSETMRAYIAGREWTYHHPVAGSLDATAPRVDPGPAVVREGNS